MSHLSQIEAKIFSDAFAEGRGRPCMCGTEENSDCSAQRADNGVFLKITAFRRRQLAEERVNSILAQAKPRFCASAPNLRGSALAGKVKPRHFYSKLFSKNGKITLLPFFPYEHTDGGECAARFIKGVPCNARRRGEKPPPVWRANLRANARQVSPLLSTISFVSSKEIVRTKFCIHKYNHPSQSRCRCR